MTEGVETASFKSLFLEWNSATDFSLKFNKNAVKKEDEAIDVQKLMAVRSLEQTAVDDGSGKSDNIFRLGGKLLFIIIALKPTTPLLSLSLSIHHMFS